MTNRMSWWVALVCWVSLALLPWVHIIALVVFDTYLWPWPTLGIPALCWLGLGVLAAVWGAVVEAR